MNSAPQRGIDGRAGRISALVVIFLCIAALLYINRGWFLGPDKGNLGKLNPDLAACLETRIGAVDQMRADAVVNDAQYEMFRGRAVAFCQTEFGDPVGLAPAAELPSRR